MRCRRAYFLNNKIVENSNYNFKRWNDPLLKMYGVHINLNVTF